MNEKAAERTQALELRRAGHSYAEIAARLGVAKSSVSLWVRDLPRPTTDEQDFDARMAGARRYYAARRRRVFVERQNEKLAWANEIGPLTDRELLIAGAVAYWAEGTKAKPWRTDERVTFTNSDPDMIRLFVAFLRRCDVGLDRLRLRVYIHETADVAAAEEFWAAVTGFARSDFQAATLKRHTPRTVRKNNGDDYHGCLKIDVLRSGDLYRQIEGIWWAARLPSRHRGNG